MTRSVIILVTFADERYQSYLVGQGSIRYPPGGSQVYTLSVVHQLHCLVGDPILLSARFLPVGERESNKMRGQYIHRGVFAYINSQLSVVDPPELLRCSRL